MKRIYSSFSNEKERNAAVDGNVLSFQWHVFHDQKACIQMKQTNA